MTDKIWEMDELQTSIFGKKYNPQGLTFSGWLDRVSGGNPRIRKLIADKCFIFAGRILAHRGLKEKVTYSNCYVQPAPEDNLESIFDTAKELARTYSYGGGCGTDISKLRPRSSKVNNSAKETTGAVSFMSLFDLTTGLIGQNGRRGALMLSIADSHPDLPEFLTIKAEQGIITKANISVRISRAFMEAVIADEEWTMRFVVKDTGEVIERTMRATDIFRVMCETNWDWAEAGMLFWDEICEWHLMSEHPDHEFGGVNPCLVGDTLIQTSEGNVPIKDLVGKQPHVYCMLEDGTLGIRQASKVWMTRKNAELVKVVTGKGELICTPDHKILTTKRGWVRAVDLRQGDKIKGLNRQMMGEKYCGVALSGTKYEKEHRFIMRHFEDIDNKIVHHKNENTLNNVKSNLEVMNHGKHSSMTNVGNENYLLMDRDLQGKFLPVEFKKKKDSINLNKTVGKNWYVKDVIILDYTEDVYDMTIPQVHNFIANDMVVHNCGEEPLMPYGSCLLGSMNLSKYVLFPFTSNATFDYDKFGQDVEQAVIGLNEVLDEGIRRHPLKKQRKNAKLWRQIGLGMMGQADMFIKMGLEYGSDESFKLANQVSHFMLNIAVMASAKLAKEKGTFPKYNKEALFKSKFFQENIEQAVQAYVLRNGLRNSQIMTIAPTGTIATMWGLSGGIEPLFAVSFFRTTESLHGKPVTYEVFPEIIREYMDFHGLTSKDQLPDFIVNSTADKLDYKKRVIMQGIWQHSIDASISSTVNLPNSATVDDVANVFILAHKAKLKGVTIYRDGCKRAGILNIDSKEASEEVPNVEIPEIETEVNGYKMSDKFVTCPDCGEKIQLITNGCSICMNCGYSPCS